MTALPVVRAGSGHAGGPLGELGNKARVALKAAARRLCFATGFTDRWGRRRQGQAHVVMYHKVERRPVGLWGTPALDLTAFERQVEFLARTYEVVPLRVLVDGLRKRQLPHRAVALTFDDGYRNNLLLAYPVLKRQHTPATVFVTAGLIGTRQWMWTSELAEMALRFGLPQVGLASGDRALASLFEVELAPSLAVNTAVDYLIRSGMERRRRVMGRLRRAFPIEPDDENRFLSWDEVRALHAGGVEIGSHTVTHPVLTEIGSDEVERELAGSRNVIAEQLGHTPTLFCYPHGTFSAEVKEITGRYYGAAVSTVAGRNTLKTDPFEIRRIAAWGVEDLAFELARY